MARSRRSASLATVAVAVPILVLAAALVSASPGRKDALKGAGIRSSTYGRPTDPGPGYWARTGAAVAAKFPGAKPEAVWHRQPSRRPRHPDVLPGPAGRRPCSSPEWTRTSASPSCGSSTRWATGSGSRPSRAGRPSTGPSTSCSTATGTIPPSSASASTSRAPLERPRQGRPGDRRDGQGLAGRGPLP
ncbi:MAG: hypothetical protein MZW92_75775 [Comamonadaceae bacterium]|nr:hypothetical protein [Comamonadaceae bacterium]